MSSLGHTGFRVLMRESFAARLWTPISMLEVLHLFPVLLRMLVFLQLGEITGANKQRNNFTTARIGRPNLTFIQTSIMTRMVGSCRT